MLCGPDRAVLRDKSVLELTRSSWAEFSFGTRCGGGLRRERVGGCDGTRGGDS